MSLKLLTLLLLLVLPPMVGLAQETPANSAKFELQTLRGRVVWMSEALAKQFGIKEVPEVAERLLALRTSDGALHPLVEDVRGRAFRRDPRFRDLEVELLARKYKGSPLLQVVQVFELQKDGKYELDYWCEICSIAMFELKDCECCQGPIELRRRKVESK
jgi:hypothetical protein